MHAHREFTIQKTVKTIFYSVNYPVLRTKGENLSRNKDEIIFVAPKGVSQFFLHIILFHNFRYSPP